MCFSPFLPPFSKHPTSHFSEFRCQFEESFISLFGIPFDANKYKKVCTKISHTFWRTNFSNRIRLLLPICFASVWWARCYWAQPPTLKLLSSRGSCRWLPPCREGSFRRDSWRTSETQSLLFSTVISILMFLLRFRFRWDHQLWTLAIHWSWLVSWHIIWESPLFQFCEEVSIFLLEHAANCKEKHIRYYHPHLWPGSVSQENP